MHERKENVEWDAEKGWTSRASPPSCSTSTFNEVSSKSMPPPYDVASSTQSSSTQSSRKSSVQYDAYVSQHTHLRPEDAVDSSSPPRKPPRASSPLGRSDTITTATAGPFDARKRREKRRGRSRSRKSAGKGTWKKLLWVKQSYPDNYTDEETFLDHLQRNPRLRPYEFWPLVADSTIIVQHVCSVVIFVCCFTGIFQERVSPQTVVGWATLGTVAAWGLREYWQIMDEKMDSAVAQHSAASDEAEKVSDSGTSGSTSGSAAADFGMPFKELSVSMIAANGLHSRPHSRNPSSTSVGGSNIMTPLTASSDLNIANGPTISSTSAPISLYQSRPSSFSPRMRERLTTAKSALLIYSSLLGLSPILKSLTKSTSSDSIWALSSWLMILNVFTFDYGAGPEARFPASLSTNAALMASTVLASRLPSTTHVFSLTLFSIEVFGLFPVFRRHLRHHSWSGHLWLTTFSVVLASGGLSMTISGGGWGVGVVGIVLGGIATCSSMGMTSWWLIGLQRYKNEIRGPWDPARPVIRRAWD